MSWQLRQVLPDSFAGTYTSDDDEEYYYNDEYYDENENNHQVDEDDNYQGGTAEDATAEDVVVGGGLVIESTNTKEHSSVVTRAPAKIPCKQQRQRKKKKKAKSQQAQKSEVEVEVLPSCLKSRPYERFFAALLRSSAKDFMSQSHHPHDDNLYDKNKDKDARLALWTDICHRVHLKPLLKPIQAKYHTEREHFEVRAALVLEESSCAIADGLAQLHHRWTTKTATTSASSGTTPSNNTTATIHPWKRRRNNNNKTYDLQQQQRPNPPSSSATMMVQLDQTQPSESEWDAKLQLMHLTFQLHHHDVVGTNAGTGKTSSRSSNHNFTKDQLLALRPGTVLEISTVTTTCINNNNNNNNTGMDLDVMLGCVAYGSREEMEREQRFTVMIFSRPPPSFFSESDNNNNNLADPQRQLEQQQPLLFQVTPVAGLISQLRQFEACTSPRSIKNQFFLNALLGYWPKHIRFTDDTSSTSSDGYGDGDDEEINALAEEMQPLLEKKNDLDDDDNNNILVAPPLNPTQEKAARQFLESARGSITLVQGPPGTGKSTLLVAIICRYLLATDTYTCSIPMEKEESHEDESNYNNNNNHHQPRRLLVSAPTNKAVTVLAARFLKAHALGERNTSYKNIVMVGDADKLLDPQEEEDGDDDFNNTQNAGESSSRHLRSIFVYTWMSELIRQFKKLRQMVVVIILQQKHSVESLQSAKENTVSEAYDLAWTLYQRLTNGLPNSTHGKIGKLARNVCERLDHPPGGASFEIIAQIDGQLDELMDELTELPKESVHQELLSSANVMFCTLATAGSNIFKRIPKVDDLIIDEASAATEPELYIPFHLKPRRLLVVGDPNQLPATVMSQRAVALGFDKSLHERLMNDCGCSYTMLDIQYRMNPGISQFPSERFYGAKITNGPNVSAKNYRTNVPLLCGKPYYFLQVDGSEEQAVCGSYRNHAEAHQVADLLQSLRSTALASDKQDDHSWHLNEKVRVITFYSAQVALLRQILGKRGLSQVLVATVDSSQGCESDLVIVSFVRSNAKVNRATSSSSLRFVAGFLNDDRRINVALTRARHQLICVGNVTAMGTMKPTSTLYELASNAQKRDCVVLNEGSSSNREVERKRKYGFAMRRKVASRY